MDTKYVIDDNDLIEITELIDSLGLVIEKLILNKRILIEEGSIHPCVDGHYQFVEKILNRLSKGGSD